MSTNQKTPRIPLPKGLPGLARRESGDRATFVTVTLAALHQRVQGRCCLPAHFAPEE